MLPILLTVGQGLLFVATLAAQFIFMGAFLSVGISLGTGVVSAMKSKRVDFTALKIWQRNRPAQAV